MSFLDAIDGPKASRPPAGPMVEPSEAYAKAALEGEVRRVSEAPEGQRNHTLYAACCALSELANGKSLDELTVRNSMAEAARSAGLDEIEIERTIQSAFDKTEGVVRMVPQRTAAEHATKADGLPKLWNARELKPAAQQRWLAKSRLQQGAINLLIGDEGIGKSLLWVWVAAAVTTGKPLDGFGMPARDPGMVCVVVTEDDWSTTVRPRLEVAGADLDMVKVICADLDGSGAPEFPRDLHLIADADPAPVLVVVDAWLDTVPARLNVQRPQDARQALHPWKEVAAQTDAAMLLLSHTNRTASAKARDKYGATGELRKIARSALFAQRDDDGRLLVGPDKSNSARPVAASTFTIRGTQHFAPTDDDDGTVATLHYTGESDRTASQHIADAFEDDKGDRQDRTAAEHWLREYLTLNPGVKSAEAKRDAAKAGIAERTLARARTSLGVVIAYHGSPPVTVWSLPVA